VDLPLHEQFEKLIQDEEYARHPQTIPYPQYVLLTHIWVLRWTFAPHPRLAKGTQPTSNNPNPNANVSLRNIFGNIFGNVFGNIPVPFL
jgi:hypothetical protein